MATLTDKLAKQMAACKRAQMDTIKDLKGVGQIAKHRHDQAVDQIRELDKQIEANPEDEELYRRRNEYDAVRGSLVHCGSYADGMQELITGRQKQPVKRHEAKDASGLFTKIGSLGHRIRQALDL